jgi:DNA-directed RNA polymerase specialized sigma subunit
VASAREIQAQRLLREYRERGNLRAREQVVGLYLPLVRALAHRHGHRGADGRRRAPEALA